VNIKIVRIEIDELKLIHALAQAHSDAHPDSFVQELFQTILGPLAKASHVMLECIPMLAEYIHPAFSQNWLADILFTIELTDMSKDYWKIQLGEPSKQIRSDLKALLNERNFTDLKVKVKFIIGEMLII
jgi:hypothetical protein